MIAALAWMTAVYLVITAVWVACSPSMRALGWRTLLIIEGLAYLPYIALCATWLAVT